MSPSLNVYALPRFAEPEELAGGAAVVIDVLRASTTIAHALESAAAQVIPCREIDQALALARALPPEDVLLGGERGGLPIEGFHLGNSPGEYSADRVAGKTIVFTTTNGTRAIEHACRADRILIGSFVNVSAVASELVGQERIHLICAGTNGQISQDDLLLAGMLVERIHGLGELAYEQNDQARDARQAWLDAFGLPCALGDEPLEPERLAAELSKSLGGRNLVAVGLQEDILAAARIDLFDGVPEFDPRNAGIRLA